VKKYKNLSFYWVLKAGHYVSNLCLFFLFFLIQLKFFIPLSQMQYLVVPDFDCSTSCQLVERKFLMLIHFITVFQN
jgi:hypothetical protein